MIDSKLAAKLPRCRYGCQDAVLFVAVPDGTLIHPTDKKQWLCQQHFIRLLSEGDTECQVLMDVVSLGWARTSLVEHSDQLEA